MKKTPFFTLHHRAGAKIVPFAGFEMPVQYSGIVEEHKAVRSSVGVFDVSHMGEVFVTGRESESFLQTITVNDVSLLEPGRAQYSAMCYENGGIIDDLLVYRLSADSFMVVVNASNVEKDFLWMKDHCPAGVQCTNRSDDYALLAVQGPRSVETVSKLCPADVTSIPYYHFITSTVAGTDAIVSRTGYTGETGFEIYFSPNDAERVWQALFDAGKEFGIMPVGLGARDTLRLEMGYCLYGNDIDQTTNPLEAGLGWITKLQKGHFIGHEELKRIKASGVRRKLVGLVLKEKAIPRHGYRIVHQGNEIGTVTSGTFSPSLEQGIAMGYIVKEHAAPGSEVAIDIRGKSVPAAVVGFPFLKRA